MKNVIKFLPAMAILFATSLAVGNQLTYNEPNVKNVTEGDGPPNWQPIEENESVNCDGYTHRFCKAYMDEDGQISEEVKGNRIP